MRPDDWHLTDDVDNFLARAGDFLHSRPALHTVPQTVTETLRTRGPHAFGAEAPVSVFSGYVTLETAGGFSHSAPDAQESWTEILNALDTLLRT